jgi:hypothetical protein
MKVSYSSTTLRDRQMPYNNRRANLFNNKTSGSYCYTRIFGWTWITFIVTVFVIPIYVPTFINCLQHSSTLLLYNGGGSTSNLKNFAAAYKNNAAVDSTLPTTTVVISTKKNGGHTLRYIIDRNVNSNDEVTSSSTSSTEVAIESSVSSLSLPLLKTLVQLHMLYRQNVLKYWKTIIVPSRNIFMRKEYWQSIYERIGSGLRSTFLPIGYPATVPDQYLSYVIWSSLQDLCTSVRSVIATQRVLQGIGVGTNTATTLSAIQNFILRDAAGMVATLSFTSFTSGIFSKDVKRWRIFADCMVDIGITLEVLAVQLPKSYFVPMLCIANMCKALCGVAAGATSGSIALYWSSKANSNNNNINNVDRSNGKSSGSTDISDINAKFGAQNTVVGSFGLIFSAIFARSVATAPLSLVWAIYSMLTAFHIFANMQCMRIIAFPYFNTLRFNHVVTTFFNQWYTSTSTSTSTSNLDDQSIQLPTPTQVAKIEPLFFINNGIRLHDQHSNAIQQQRRRVPIFFGVSLNEYLEKSVKVEPNTVLDFFYGTSHQCPYLISIGSTKPLQSKTVAHANFCINVALPSNTNAYTQAQAYFHAALYRRIMYDTLEMNQNNNDMEHPGAIIDDVANFHQIVDKKVQNIFPMAWERFVTECTKAGWDLSRTELHSGGYELAVQES